MFLRQSTAQTIRFGPCLDKTDGVTEETALTLAQADMRLSKDGGAFAQKNAVGNATHDSDGWYSTSLDATDTATVGELVLNVHQPANMLPVWMRFYVVEEAVYDALFAAAAPAFGSDNKVLVSSDAQDLSTTLDVRTKAFTTGAIDSAAIATDAIGSAELATTAVNEIRDSIISDATTFAGGNIDAAVSSRATPAQVNTEVLDVMNVDTFAEPGQGAPAATASIFSKINYLYKAWRNKVTQTSTEYKLYADDTTTVDQKATVSDDATTYTSGEVGTGP